MSTNSGAESALVVSGNEGRWGESCLNVARVMAIGAVALVPASTAACSICIGLMLLAWLASGRALQTLSAAASQPMGRAILLFVALITLDVLYSPGSWAERWGSLWSWRKLVWGFLLLGLFADTKWKLRFVSAFVVVASLGLVASYLGWAGLIPSRQGHFPAVYFTNHTTQGMTFALAALCCIELMKVAPPDYRRLLAIGAVAFLVNVVFVSMSRSGYIAIFCVMLVCYVRMRGGKSILWTTMAVALTVLAVLSFSPNVRDRIKLGIEEVETYRTSPTLTSAGVRMVFLINTLQLAREQPLFGYGTGSFARVYRERFGAESQGWQGGVTSDPHNQYLFILVENGLLGMGVFLALLVLGLRAARVPGPYTGILQAALFAWCMTSLFNSHFRTFPEGHLIWLFFGAMLASRRAVASAPEAA